MVLEGHAQTAFGTMPERSSGAIGEVIETFIAEVEAFGLTAGGGSTAIVNGGPKPRLGDTYEFVIEGVENVSTVLVVIHSTVIAQASLGTAALFDVQVVEIDVKEAADRWRQGFG